ncbi:MAG: toll/interleukin-1 receptor domain-containing protein [Hyphomonadaceae bacterium]|nr:toll/interleukin-1 receptor domain-containing protein [Hyphomonadaceae bacterium]
MLTVFVQAGVTKLGKAFEARGLLFFISYRRQDTQYEADRLCSFLRPLFAEPDKNIFIDIDNIPLGVDFEEHLKSQVARCEILLALIGKGWLEATDPKTGLRRLDLQNDFVRIEISSALQRGIRVIPILFDGAEVPSEVDLPTPLKPLSKRHGIQINRISFESDVMRLLNGLNIKAGSSGEPASPLRPTHESSKKEINQTNYSTFLNEFLLPVLKCLQKDNAIWSRILGVRKDASTLEFKIAAQIEKEEIFPNHQKVIDLIGLWRHEPIVDDDTELAEVLDAYLDHVTVYKTIRQTGDLNSLPIDVGAPWPDAIYAILQKRVQEHQQSK